MVCHRYITVTMDKYPALRCNSISGNRYKYAEEHKGVHFVGRYLYTINISANNKIHAQKCAIIFARTIE